MSRSVWQVANLFTCLMTPICWLPGSPLCFVSGCSAFYITMRRERAGGSCAGVRLGLSFEAAHKKTTDAMVDGKSHKVGHQRRKKTVR